MPEWVCQCGKHYRHKRSYTRHVRGAAGRKPCGGGASTPLRLRPHRGDDLFPPSVSSKDIKEILGGRTEEVAARLLQGIHLRPHDPKAKAYCNVVWPNVNRSEVMTYDGEGWVRKDFSTWILGFWAWVYRCWKAVGLEAERDAFIRLLAIRHQQWTVAVKAVRSALLESRTRSSVKALLGMR